MVWALIIGTRTTFMEVRNIYSFIELLLANKITSQDYIKGTMNNLYYN